MPKFSISQNISSETPNNCQLSFQILVLRVSFSSEWLIIVADQAPPIGLLVPQKQGSERGNISPNPLPQRLQGLNVRLRKDSIFFVSFHLQFLWLSSNHTHLSHLHRTIIIPHISFKPIYKMLREKQKPSMKMMLLWMALDKLTGNGKEIDRIPMSSYRRSSEPLIGSKHRKASNYQPPPLVQSLPRRKGYITPPTLELEKLEQLQSPLFTLPKEVLLLIYEQVIGNNILHIVRRSNKLSHATCSSNRSGNPDDCRDLKCRGMKLQNGVSIPDGPSYGGILPLLQTCRKM